MLKCIDCIIKIITNVLISIHQTAGFSIIMAALFMFAYMIAKEHGWKNVLNKWWFSFKTDYRFRRILCLAFYTSMILFRTLFYRGIWRNPLENVVGVWGIYNKYGELTTEVIENLMLFIPFTVLYLWAFKEKLFSDVIRMKIVLWKATKVTFFVTLTIEVLQLLICVGTFQLSDLFYNTLGGFIGGIVYYIIYRWKHRKKRSS